MTNQEKIKEYLVGKDGYLKSDISNGKVIMLSGKWGSGKTHFWQHEIATDNLKKELKIEKKAYSYISLYGKSSIEEIESDIFTQIYFDANGGENLVTKTSSTFTKYAKRYGSLVPTFDLSKLAEGLDEEGKGNKQRIALERLNNGGVICFDDFERKSKDIDLNDLFGFITQLSLNFECKVVIILNDDVFEGKEKDIFSNVKEKTVSKFLNYIPSIEELFNLIFEDYKDNLIDYRDIILKTIENTNTLNARIYMQVLDNINEFIQKTECEEDKFIKYLILVNINFILNHYGLYLFNLIKDRKEITLYSILKERSDNFIKVSINTEEKLPDKLLDYLRESKNINESIENILYKEKANVKRRTDAVDHGEILSKFIENNKPLINSILFFYSTNIAELFDSNNLEECEIFNKVNNFIETGILIKDS